MGRPTSEESDKTFRRLPKCIVPIHYTLSFQPDEQEPILNGRISIRVQVMCETQEIILNALNIEVSKVEYTSEETKEKQDSKDILVNEDTETLQIGFLTALKPGFGLLSMDFEAQITDTMKGLYRTQVINASGQTSFNYITHFEPVNARRCFPSWDEPAFKSTFDVTLIVPKDVVAIANMPLKEEKPHEKNDKLRVCTYETTPRMSTYLIAFVIGDFDFIEKVNENGTLVRVFTPPGKQVQGEFALDLIAKALTHYTKYFGVPYPLPKCDVVAIREFPIGGMENYGLITFRDTRLLVDPQETSSVSRQITSLIISHEVSHMWFGNLVTMKWWTDLWLKEGFAKFMEYVCADHFFPEFDLWTQFTTDILSPALQVDSLKSSHPIEVPVTNPSEIDEIFDIISYRKGASIIKMLYNYVGDADFRKGLNIYLTRFEFKNAETFDLWESLSEASGKPIGKLMDTFTKQMGFPLVTVVDVQHDSNLGSRTFTLKQEKFWANSKLYSEEHSSSNSNYKWIIPITFCKGSKPSAVAFDAVFDGLVSDSTTITVPDVNADEFVKLNYKINGFYRVCYAPEVLTQFKASIRDKTMSPVDRLGLIDDLYATVKSGRSSVIDILNLLEAFENEDNYTVWSCIRNIIADLSNLLNRTELLDKFNAFSTSIFQPLKQRLGWDKKDGESHTDGLLRSLVLRRLTASGDIDTINEAGKLFEQHLSGDKMIPADLRTVVYRAVLSTGDSKTLDVMLNMYRDSELSEEKVRILQSLGAVKDKALMRKILEFGISEEVKPSDIASVLMSMCYCKDGQDENWQFFKDNIKLFQERYPGGMLICTVVNIVTNNFTGEDFADEVESFLTKNRIRGTDRTVQQSVENIRINTAWLARDLQSIAKFLKL